MICVKKHFSLLLIGLFFYFPSFAQEDIMNTTVSDVHADNPTLGVDFFTCVNFSQSSLNKKSKRIPEMSYVDGLISNLDGTVWRLKFHPNADFSQYAYILLSFFGSDLVVDVAEVNRTADTGDKRYTLVPVKMYNPDEGIFAYVTYPSQVFFIYIRLMLSHLLALHMCQTYEEAEDMKEKSITELGIFVLE